MTFDLLFAEWIKMSEQIKESGFKTFEEFCEYWDKLRAEAIRKDMLEQNKNV